MISVGSEVQVLPGPPVIRLLAEDVSGGHSSAGRAPALQAGGHRFESGCLHYSRSASAEMAAKRTSGNDPPEGASRRRLRRTPPRSGREANNPPDGHCKVRCDFPTDVGPDPSCWALLPKQTVSRKGHEIVAVSFSQENNPVHAGRRMDALFRGRRICSLSG